MSDSKPPEKKRWLLSKDATAIVVALLALPVGMGIEYTRHYLESRKADETTQLENCKKEAAYLETMADALARIATDLKNQKTPYEADHVFVGMLGIFDRELNDVLGNDEWSRLSDLRELENSIELADPPVRIEGMKSPRVVKAVEDSERAAGALRARAQQIRLKNTCSLSTTDQSP